MLLVDGCVGGLKVNNHTVSIAGSVFKPEVLEIEPCL